MFLTRSDVARISFMDTERRNPTHRSGMCTSDTNSVTPCLYLLDVGETFCRKKGKCPSAKLFVPGTTRKVCLCVQGVGLIFVICLYAGRMFACFSKKNSLGQRSRHKVVTNRGNNAWTVDEQNKLTQAVCISGNGGR